MTVAAVLKEKGADVVTVGVATTLPEISNIIASRRIGAVVVQTEGNELAGIVSERDVVKAIASHGEAALRLTAGDIMTRLVTTATPQTTINDAMTIMDAGYFRHLPVLENGHLLGIISVRDVVRAMIRDRELEVDTLHAYVTRGVQVGGLR